MDERLPKLIVGGLAAILAITTVLTSFEQVDEGYRGVYIVLGKANETPLTPGLHTKIPLISEVREIDARQKKYTAKTSASSKDLQTVNTAIALNYKPSPEAIPYIYSTIGETNEIWENVVMRPAVEEVTKSVTADNTAAELVTKREVVKAEITELLIKRLAKENYIVTEVSITDFSFSPSFMAAIEAKQVAEQEAMRAENELTKHTTEVKKKEETAKAEAAATLTLAEAQRKAAVLKARGIAEAIQIEAEAEAQYHERTGKVVSRDTLRLREIQRWNGVMPEVVAGDKLGLMLDRSKAQ